MKVKRVMNAEPRTVRPEDALAEAARAMHDQGCGWLPVTDGGRVVGVITDRDICMAACTRGMPLEDMVVEGTMTTDVFLTHPGDALGDALALMRVYRVRRLPVVDDAHTLVGILSLTDVSRRAAIRHGGVLPAEVVATISAISEPRSGAAVV
jgi:CBS domain-containing protein